MTRQEQEIQDERDNFAWLITELLRDMADLPRQIDVMIKICDRTGMKAARLGEFVKRAREVSETNKAMYDGLLSTY